MSKILFVNACVRPASRTLVLARRLLETLGGDFDEVDITDGSVKPLDAAALAYRTEKCGEGDFSDAVFLPAKRFAAAQTVVIAAPFWDFSFPACLKIYLENILVAGLTFTYEGGRPTGLCKAKRMYYVTTAGGRISPDFGFPYLQAISENLLGIPEVKCLCAEGLDIGGNDAEHIIEEAAKKICRGR